ncbi:unnamed protein product [Sphagnum balticum]
MASSSSSRVGVRPSILSEADQWQAWHIKALRRMMQAIGTNSIRVYHVDPYVNARWMHVCLADANIYVWLDLDTFNTTINQPIPNGAKNSFSHSPMSWMSSRLRQFGRILDWERSHQHRGWIAGGTLCEGRHGRHEGIHGDQEVPSDPH